MKRWLRLLPQHLAIALAVLICSPIANALFVTPDRRYLTRWRWLETIDSDLGGDRDEGWQKEHLWGSDPYSWLNRTRWLWRNGGNRYNYETIGCPFHLPIQTSPYRWENSDGNWLYRRHIPLAFGLMLDLYFGWGLTGPKHGRCKYVCTVRLKTKP